PTRLSAGGGAGAGRRRRGRRALGWVGAVGLTAYGLVNTVTALAVLAGLINVVGTDRLGLMGHAFLRDPLFTLWGSPSPRGSCSPAPRPVSRRSESPASAPAARNDHGPVFTARLPCE